MYYDMETSYSDKKGSDINSELLEKQPEKHTFIFLKEKARCSKTFTKTNIGVWYERFAKKFSDDVVTQGLLGRATGYDDNGDSIIYTNIESVKQYLELWNKGFDRSVEWISNTTKVVHNETESLKTFNGVVYNGEKPIIPPTISTEPTIKKFYGEWGVVKDNIKAFLSENKLAKRGPNKKSPKEDGFYHGTIRTTKGIFTTDIVDSNKGWGINDKHKYRIHPCYTNVKDPSTLEWWLIYKV